MLQSPQRFGRFSGARLRTNNNPNIYRLAHRPIRSTEEFKPQPSMPPPNTRTPRDRPPSNSIPIPKTWRPPYNVVAPPTAAQVQGTVPRFSEVRPGVAVFVVRKEDQSNARETYGIVQDVLTRSDHWRGVKVRLRSGEVGRVQRLGFASATTSSSSAPASAGQRSAPQWKHSKDIRNENQHPEGPPPRTLADFIPSIAEDQAAPQAFEGRDFATSSVKCPICGQFEGDEAAVTHHIDQKHPF